MWMTPCCNLAVWYDITPGPHYDLPGLCHVNMFTLCTGTLNTYIIFICNLFTLFVFACMCVSFFCLWGVCSTVGRLDVKKERKEKVTTNKQQRKKRKKRKKREKRVLLVTKLTLTSFFPLAISFSTSSISNPQKSVKSYCFNPDEYCWR